VVLQDSRERVFSSDADLEQVELGLYIVRGDNIALIGELDDDPDVSDNLLTVRADPIKPVTH